MSENIILNLAKYDSFNCVAVSLMEGSSGIEPGMFSPSLERALEQWRAENRKAVWLKMSTSCAHFIDPAVKQGFEFHHAKPGYVMLNKWLSPTKKNNLPGYATHYIGVGGFVLNDNEEVLVVQEKQYGAHWKLPGGLVEPGEDFARAAIREVFEETGIRCHFISVVALDENHGHRWGCDDLYFVVLLRPIKQEDTHSIQKCPDEIHLCRWMPLQEYLKSDEVLPLNRHLATCVWEGLKRHKGNGGDDTMTKAPPFATALRVRLFAGSDVFHTVFSATNDPARHELTTTTPSLVSFYQDYQTQQ